MLRFSLLPLALLVLSSPLADARAADQADHADHAFIGVGGCKMCHSKEATGDQFGKWSAGPHSKAWELLGTEAAQATATAAGIKGSPQEAPECLQCHVTAFGVDAALLGKKYKVEECVGCESCHGAGDGYKSMTVMKDQAAAVAAGLVLPTEATCTGCHNDKSPTFTGFDFAEYFSRIAHPNPSR